MTNLFAPRLDILPPAQRRLWPELGQTPDHFTLYGGTAIALRLGHRQSVDFDFFSAAPFEPQALLESLPYLKGARTIQSATNTLTVRLDDGDPVQLSYFGGLDLGQVATVDFPQDIRLPVASLVDLAGTKVAVVTQRAEVRDYLDIHALLTKAKISLPTMLAAAGIIYGNGFNPLISLKAIAFHDDLTLAELPLDVRRDLLDAVKKTDLQQLPVLKPVRGRGQTP